MIYTVKQAATAAGISATTVRSWSDRFRAYLSDEANPPNQGKRQYSEDDISILRTIKFLRDNQQEWAYIHEALDGGERYMPDSAQTRVETRPAPETSASRELMPPELVERLMAMVEASNTSMLAAEKRAIKAELEADRLRQELEEIKSRGFWARLFGR